ncbi:MAG: glycosyltransferase [Candidatus Latescibacterota bacterium]|nr:glycosyltransferase [Candidatus Latescibacterota bacterium]
MIVRDEAAHLQRCLTSIRGLVDEIVIVDTGSSDDSVAVAQRHDARVFHFEWADDFSAARNFGLDRARGRWILCLDCDEVVAEGDHGALRLAIRGSADAYRITTRNYSEESDRASWTACDGVYVEQEKTYSGWFPTTKVRLWRRRKTTRFQGAVHELVEPSLQVAGAVIVDCVVPVHHYGYVEKQRQSDRYLELGERKVAESPDDLRAHFELAIAYRDAGRLDDALEYIERVRAAASRDVLYLDPEHVELVYGDVLDRLGCLEEAAAAYRTIIELFPQSFQAYNNLGSLYSRQGQFVDAADAYEKGLALAPKNPILEQNLAKIRSALPAMGQEEASEAAHRLSVCMIVRDAAATVDRALSSIAAMADEIIVVDTGSADDTVQRVQAAGAQVYHFTWCDDFAAARNESLRHASGDWIFWLDADDYLLPEDAQRVAAAKKMSPDQAFYFTLQNTGGHDRTCFQQVKMFPNADGIRFERPVHETVVPTLRRLGIPVRPTDARVMHTGYADPQVVAEKCSRYAAIMQKWIKQHPEDLDTHFRLGHTAYSDNDRETAVAHFDTVLASPELDAHPTSLRRHALTFRGRCRLEMGDWEQAIPDVEAALTLDGNEMLANLTLGDALTKAQQRDRAIVHLEKALQRHVDSGFPLDRDLIEYSTRFFLAENLSSIGRVTEAIEHLEAAAALQPERTEASQVLAQLRLSRGGDAGTTVATGKTGLYEQSDSVASMAELENQHPDARLSLCMIVRNEEEKLATCLQSVQGLVDEIVVVDTGSTDRTVEIAREHGAVLGSFEWRDDFSAARNVSLSMATGDWIMWLDADDVLPAESHGPIRQLVSGPQDRGYFFMLDDRGYESVSCLQMRLFPKREGVMFEMPIHEQVTLSLSRLGIDMAPTDIRVVHTGYTTQEVVAEKTSRYLEIMERWLNSHPEDYIVRSHVGLIYHTRGRLDEAIEQYRIIVEESQCQADHNYVVYTTALLFLGRSWMKKGGYETALTWVERAEEVDPDYVLTKFSLAEIHLEIGDPHKALHYVRGARETPQLTFFPIDQTELAYSCLTAEGRALALTGDLEGAEQSLRQAAATPVARRSEALGMLSEILQQQQQFAAALKVLQEALEIAPNHPKHRFNAAMIHLDQGKMEAAKAGFEELLEIMPGHPPALLNLGFISKSRGDVEAAESYYRAVLDNEPDHADALANLAHLLLAAEREQEAVEMFQRVRQLRPGLLDIELGELAAGQAINRWNDELAQELLRRFPTVSQLPAAGVPGDVSSFDGSFFQLGLQLVKQELAKCAEIAFSISARCGEGEAGAMSEVSAGARCCLAELFASQQQFWKAVAEYEVLLRADPCNGDAFRRLGDCYSKLGVEDAAQMCYDRSLQCSEG